MKKFSKLLLILFVCVSTIAVFGQIDNKVAHAAGAVFHVAKNGSDSNPGTSALPFLTVNKAAQVATAGDSVLIHAGTYRETVTPLNSGTSTAPIIYQAAPGEKVTISGADIITGWTVYNGSKYQASMPWTLGKGKDQVFVDGSVVVQARYPQTNTSGQSFKVPVSPLYPTLGNLVSQPVPTSAPGGTTGYITSPTDLNQSTNFWNGAIYNGAASSAWSWQSGIVSSSGNGFLNLTNTTSRWWFNTAGDWPENMAGFLTDSMNAFTYAGSWQNQSNILYMWMNDSSNPSGHVIEAKRRQLAFDLRNRNYVQVKNLSIFASSITMNFANNILIDNCILSYISHSLLWDDGREGYIDNYLTNANNTTGVPQKGEWGIFIGGNDDIIQNSTIAYSSGAGVYTTGLRTTLNNNIIHDTGYAMTYIGAVVVGFDPQSDLANTPRGAHTITNNTFYNSGRGVVNIQGADRNPTTVFQASNISNNIIRDGNLFTDDGGVFYTFRTIAGTGGQRTQFNNNIVANSWGNYWRTLLYNDGDSSLYDDHNNLLVQTVNPNKVSELGYGLVQNNNTGTGNQMWDNSFIYNNTGTLSGLTLADYPMRTYFAAGANHDDHNNPSPLATPSPANINPYRIIEAETYSSMSGVLTEANSLGGTHISNLDNGDYVVFNNVDFGSGGAGNFEARAASAGTGGNIEVRLDSLGGTLVTTLPVPVTGGWQTWFTHASKVTGATGVHNVYLKFTGAGTGLFNVDWVMFNPAVAETVQPYSGATILRSETADSNYGVSLYSVGTARHDKGTWLAYKNVDLGANYTRFAVNIAVTSPYNGGQIEVRLDGTQGTLLGTLTTTDTTGWYAFQDQSIPISSATGIHDIYIRFLADGTGNINYFKFYNGSAYSPTPLPKSAYKDIEAENYSSMSGITTEPTTDLAGGINVGGIEPNDYAVYNNVNFGSGGAGTFLARVASANSGGNIEVRLDSLTGTLVGTLQVPGTGGWQNWISSTVNISGATGTHNVYLKFTGSGTGLFNVNWFQFFPTVAVSQIKIEGESYDTMSGITTGSGGSGTALNSCDNGDWVQYIGVNFDKGYNTFTANVAVDPANAGKTAEIHLDSLTGTLAGTLTVASTGSWTTFQEQSTSLTGASGIHNVYVKFVGGSGVGNFDYFKFSKN